MHGPNPYAAPLAPDAHENARRDANLALALAIASVLVCAPVLGPLAMWKAVGTLKTSRPWQGIAAIVLAGVGLASSAVFWFLALWQYLAPS